jgi:hypothetical protein
MPFHSRDGLFFTRTTTGDVIVTFEVPVHDMSGNYADGHSAVLHRIVLPENEWASVLASMSSRGEDVTTWQEAREFHARIA